jgi:hypothetical protein
MDSSNESRRKAKKRRSINYLFTANGGATDRSPVRDTRGCQEQKESYCNAVMEIVERLGGKSECNHCDTFCTIIDEWRSNWHKESMASLIAKLVASMYRRLFRTSQAESNV